MENEMAVVSGKRAGVVKRESFEEAQALVSDGVSSLRLLKEHLRILADAGEDIGYDRLYGFSDALNVAISHIERSFDVPC